MDIAWDLEDEENSRLDLDDATNIDSDDGSDKEEMEKKAVFQMHMKINTFMIKIITEQIYLLYTRWYKGRCPTQWGWGSRRRYR